jgi:hypothetical protein
MMKALIADTTLAPSAVEMPRGGGISGNLGHSSGFSRVPDIVTRVSQVPATKVARYLQIENKIRSVLRYDLASVVPLVPQRTAVGSWRYAASFCNSRMISSLFGIARPRSVSKSS